MNNLNFMFNILYCGLERTSGHGCGYSYGDGYGHGYGSGVGDGFGYGYSVGYEEDVNGASSIYGIPFDDGDGVLPYAAFGWITDEQS